VAAELDPLAAQQSFGGVVGFKAKAQARERALALVAFVDSLGPDAAPIGSKLRRRLAARGFDAPPPRHGPPTTAVARDVSFDPADGALLLDGQRPGTWQEAQRALDQLGDKLSGVGRASVLEGLDAEQRRALLDTARRAADGSLLDSSGGAPSAGQLARLRRSAARVMGGLTSASLRSDGATDPALARDALSAATDLALAEPDERTRRAMVSDLYRLYPDLPGELKSIPQQLTRDYVPVWAYESDPAGPGGLQPIPAAHFDTDAEGKVTGLSGPRVNVVIPEEIATKMDDFGLRPEEMTPNPLPSDLKPGPAAGPATRCSGARTASSRSTPITSSPTSSTPTTTAASGS